MKIKYIEFIDWVKKKGKVVVIYDKKQKKNYNLETWIVEIDNQRKEYVKKVEILENDNLNPNDAPIKQWLVPNCVTDTREELEAYDKFRRVVLGRAGARIVKNDKLVELKRRDIERKKVILLMIKNPKYILYKRHLRLKYACMNSPSISTFRQWQRTPQHIKTTINEAIKEYE